MEPSFLQECYVYMREEIKPGTERKGGGESSAFYILLVSHTGIPLLFLCLCL